MSSKAEAQKPANERTRVQLISVEQAARAARAATLARRYAAGSRAELAEAPWVIRYGSDEEDFPMWLGFRASAEVLAGIEIMRNKKMSAKMMDKIAFNPVSAQKLSEELIVSSDPAVIAGITRAGMADVANSAQTELDSHEENMAPDGSNVGVTQQTGVVST